MKKRITYLSPVLSCIFAALIISVPVTVSSEYRFREFNSDREKFERYRNQAEKSATEQQWQDILETGKREMVTQWERTAENELERYVRNGAAESEVRVSLEEAKAEWESEFDKAEAHAKGSWYVSREKLVFEHIDFTELKEIVRVAGEESDVTDIESWDSYVSKSLTESESAWEKNYLLQLAGLKSIGESMTDEVKSGFDAELARLEHSLRYKFEVERNSILYSARNSFINELYVDTDSLRYRSDQQSAETSTENIIKDVQSDLKSEEDKILIRNYTVSGEGIIDFSAMGDNWQDELKQLVKSGMERWNAALEKLYSRMLNWKTEAENAYQSAEALWRKAAEKLEMARFEWEKKLSDEINESLALWIDQQNDLRENIERAQTDLSEYMENLSAQWNDHSSSLVDMAVNGSKVYSDALENIKWLEKMCSDAGNGNQGAFGIKDTPVSITDNFWSILTAEEKAAIENSVSDKRSEFGYKSLDDRYFDEVCEDEFCITKKHVPVNFYEGSYTFIITMDGNAGNIPAETEGMDKYFGSYYYDSVYYKTVFTGAVEKRDNSGNWYLEENYIVKAYLKRMVYGQKYSDEYGIYTVNYGWYQNEEYVTSFNITNSVTKDSADYEKSSYYYYKTELERWNIIRNQFADIASDAEYYMHEYNMLGEDGGPGYLAKDDSVTNDPYLMTDAEFQLELAKRDKEFWQQRLDIAKAVLDYAEETKRESAEETERNKADAYKDMEEKKGVYEANLNSVNSIILELKKLQGEKPLEELNDNNRADWDAYNASIEYMSEQYRSASRKFVIAENEYNTIKRLIIILENGETDEFLKKQISDIEKNIVETERDIYLQRIELYSAQMQREYSERTAKYAGSYKDAVMEYEESKRLFNELAQIVNGEENDTSLYVWGEAIISSDVLKDLEYDTGLVDGIKKYSVILGELVADPAKKSDLSSFIRDIYFSLQNRMNNDELIVKTLQNLNFDAESFLKESYTGDHAIYKDYAEMSIEALELVKEAIDTAGTSDPGSYNDIIGGLYRGFTVLKYNYGGDNREYIVRYAACMYFEENFKGLSSGDWERAKNRLRIDIDYNEEAADVHDDLATMNSVDVEEEVAEYQKKASEGDMEAVAWLREYYKSGSGIAAIEYIKVFDIRAEADFESYMILKQFVYENTGFFRKDQLYMKDHLWLEDIAGYINRIVPVETWGDEFTFEGIKKLDAESMNLALTAFQNYIETIEDAGRAVPEFLINAADELLSLKAKLNQQIFIKRYMSNDSSDEMHGTADEIYDRKNSDALKSERILDFIEGARDAIDAGAGDDYKIVLGVLSLYDQLSEDEKKYLRESDDDNIKSVNSFIQELYSGNDAVELAVMASDFNQMGVSVTPDDFASMKGVTAETKDKLIAAVTPAYDIKVFNRDFGDGKITDIKTYISNLDISSDRKESLLNYALITEYTNRVLGNNVTSTDPAFAKYRTFKKFEDLPEEVRIYLASQYYYQNKFLNNEILKSGIDDYLETEFGEAGISSAVVDAVEKYIGRLNAVSLFYTGDINEYADTLDPDASKYFLMYVNGEYDALLPGFEYGVYGGAELEALVNVEVGRMTSALDSYCNSYSETFNAQMKQYNTARAGLDCAAALKDFIDGGEGANWRDGVFAVTEEVEAEVQDEEQEGAEYEEKNLILLSIYEITGEWADILDAETGMKSTLVKSSTRLERDGKVFSQSGIIDSMNSILSVFESLNESLKDNYKTDGARGIAEFMNQAGSIYSFDTNYATLSDGSFIFETAMNELVTEYEGESSSFSSAENEIKNGFNGFYTGIAGMKNSVVSKKGSYDLLAAEGGIDELKIKLEAARVRHESAKEELALKEKELRDAQNRYAGKNIEYVETMEDISRSYKAYQESEFAYEKVYAKWEYANTPYLMNTLTDAAQITIGESVSGDVVSYQQIPVPDARENYDRIKEKFDKANEDYDKALEVVNSQDTVEKINSDINYSRDKTGFVDSTQSFIRLSQVYAEITEDLDVYERECDLAEKIYTSSKDNIAFYNSKINKKDSVLTEKEKSELIELRDKILAHILKTNGDSTAEIEKYINGISWYTCAKTVERYNILISETEALKAAVLQEAESCRETIAELNGEMADLENTAWPDNNDSEIARIKSEINDLVKKIEECGQTISTYDYKIGELIGDRNVYIADSDNYSAMSEETKKDIENIYARYMTDDCLKVILDNYPAYIYKKREYEHACYEVGRTHNPIKKRRWKRKRDSRRDDMNYFLGTYLVPINKIKESIEAALTAKTDYQQKSSVLNSMISVRYIDEIKEYLKQSMYSLSDYDLNIYDSNNPENRKNDESLNITGLRDEKQRKDLDGSAVKAMVITIWDEEFKKNIRMISVLDKDGKETGERYSIDDRSVVLKSGGSMVDNYSEGLQYDFYDNNYNLKSVTSFLTASASERRQACLANLKGYMYKTKENGGFDKKVVLQDLEQTYSELQDFAVEFNYNNSKAEEDDREQRQRSFDGYITITKEYVFNGAGESIQGLIINELIKQNIQLQNQLWKHQTEKLNERKERWSEVIGYIMNRGYREWRENIGEFKNRWTKWRHEARKMIEDGEEWWKSASVGMTIEMNAWMDETTKGSSKEAAARIYNDLEARIKRYETDIKNRMPGSVNFNLSTDKIFADSMKNTPVDSIGVLKNSMSSVDTTAGFTNMLNLGLSGDLTQRNEEQMKEYTDAMSIMSNLRVIDILNGIIDGFNKQLGEANRNVYDGVDRYIRKNETFISAPFNRNESENSWSIRVCVESNLIGGEKYKTRTFADYDYYDNATVYLKPVKGLNGTTIDFTDAKTYSKLDSEELDTYVGLETEWLNRSIEDIFREGGTFSGHQQEEYTRLSDSFVKYYTDWVSGESLKNAGLYAKPIIPHGPNLMVTAAIAASMTGQVWVAALVATVSTGTQMADGTLSFKHGMTQIAVGAASSISASFLGPGGSMLVNMAASGIDYEEGGGIGWSNKKFKDGVKSGAVKLAMSTALSYSGVNSTTSGNFFGTISSTIVSSGLETDGHWYNIGFDTDNWSQHITTGIAAGLSQWISDSTENDTFGKMMEQGVMTLGYNFRDGKGFNDDYGKYNWNAMAPTAQGLGSMLGNMASSWYKKQNTQPDSAQADAGRMPVSPVDPIGAIDNMLQGLWYGLDKSKKFMNSIKDSIAGIAKDIGLTDIFDSAAKVAGDLKTSISGFFVGIDKGVVDLAQSVGNKIAYGEFGTDDDPVVIRAVAQDKFKEYVDDGRIEKDSLVYYQMKEQLGIPLSDEEVQMMLIRESEAELGIQEVDFEFMDDKTAENLFSFFTDKPGSSVSQGEKDTLTQLKENFKEITDGKGKVLFYETEVNGVKFKMLANENNTLENIQNSDNRIWETMANAAIESGVDRIEVRSVMHDLNEAHQEGRGMDVTGFFVTDENGDQKYIPAYRNYDNENKQWEDVDDDVLNINREFNEYFMDQDDSLKALNFDKMWDKSSDEEPYSNMINEDEYADVGGAGSRVDRDKKNGFNNYSNDYDLTASIADRLWLNYSHTGHAHYAVRRR